MMMMQKKMNRMKVKMTHRLALLAARQNWQSQSRGSAKDQSGQEKEGIQVDVDLLAIGDWGV